VVDVYINYLRKKLGAVVGEGDAACPVIETVRGEGYQMGGLMKMAPQGSSYSPGMAYANA
jgi:DNA-binding winged helix-turn-helix (wHTH) protein